MLPLYVQAASSALLWSSFCAELSPYVLPPPDKGSSFRVFHIGGCQYDRYQHGNRVGNRRCKKDPLDPKETRQREDQGIKHTISRITDAIMARSGLPTAWKKMDDILMVQVKAISDRKMRNVFSANNQ